MDWNRLGNRLLFPHRAVLLLLLPLSAGLLVFALLRLDEADPLRIASYLLAFYTLTLWCARVPRLLRRLRHFRQENKYIRRWVEDPRLRTNVSLTGNTLWNGAYAALQLGLGIRHHLAWYYFLSAYYASLAVMRLSLVRYTLHHRPGERMRQELNRYRACGWIFLIMNLALTGMLLGLIFGERAVRHHEITVIAMAAYTFTTLTLAIRNVFQYRRYNSPALSASKAISLAAASVSMLILENTMLATFHNGALSLRARRLILGLSGGAVSVCILIAAIYMIVQSSKRLRNESHEQQAL